MVTISEIEDAIESAVTAGLPYLKTVGPIADFLSRKADEIAILCPAVFVAYERGRFQDAGANYLMDRNMVFTLIAVVGFAVTQSKLLHGDSNRKGIYTVLEDLRGTLTGNSMGLPITGLVPVEESAVAGDRWIAVYGISFQTRSRG